MRLWISECQTNVSSINKRQGGRIGIHLKYFKTKYVHEREMIIVRNIKKNEVTWTVYFIKILKCQ